MIVVLAIAAQRLAARLLRLFRVQVTARLAGQADVQRVETATRVIRYVATAVIVRCRFKARTLEQWAVRREFLRRPKTAFDACGIEIPYPQVTFHAAAGPPTAAIPPALQAR